MAQAKINFEQFIEAVDVENKPFVQDLHNIYWTTDAKQFLKKRKAATLLPINMGNRKGQL